MQRWSEHVRDITGDYPQIVPGKIIDLTEIEIEEPAPVDDGMFGPGERLDVIIPDHLLKGGLRTERYFEWR